MNIQAAKQPLSWIRHPKRMLSLRQDAQETMQTVAPLQTRHVFAATRKAVLVALTDSPYELKLLGMFALFLSTEGVESELLLEKAATRRSRKYAAAFGISRVSYFDDELRKQNSDATMLAQDLLREYRRDSSTFKTLCIDGWWAGPQVLAALITEASPTLQSIKVSDQDLLHLISLLAHRHLTARRYLEQKAFDIGLCIEANGPWHGPVVDALLRASRPVVQITQPNRDNGFYQKRLRIHNRRDHPSSVSRAELEDFALRPFTMEHKTALIEALAKRYQRELPMFGPRQPRQIVSTREEFCDALGLDKYKRIAVVFPHILWDANLFYGEDLFDDYADWLVETIRACQFLQKTTVLVKLHPANQWKSSKGPGMSAESRLLESHPELRAPHITPVPPDVPISTWSFFEHADCGITVRGTVGVEMSCLGKPILTAGTGRYSNMGFTIDSLSRDQYLDRVRKLDDQPPLSPAETLKAQQHAYLALVERPWRLSSFTIEERNLSPQHPLSRNIRPRVTSREELLRSNDCRKWLKWVLESEYADYMDYRYD